MAALPKNYYPNTKVIGLTLIEVLIALAIASIALTAIIKAVTENISGTNYLQNKTMGMWVGQQVLNQVRAGVLVLPSSSDKRKEFTELLDKKWYWQAWQEDSANQRIKHIFVRVSASDDEDAKQIITMETYVYHQE